MRKVVVIGAGHAGCGLAAALRQKGFDGSVTLLAAEASLPYQRPPLSKAFLLGEVGADDLHLRPPSFFTENDIELRSACPAAAIDRQRRCVVLANGESLGYDALVLATGAHNRKLRIPGEELTGVESLRTLEDAVRLKAGLQRGGKLVIIGAGFIGMEVAAVASRMGLDVTIVEQAPRALGRVLSESMSDFLVAQQRARGMRVVFDSGVAAILDDGQSAVAGVSLTSGEVLEADFVLVAAGAVASDELARQAGLPVRNGIVVDAFLRTTDEFVFAIGDCANFPFAGLPGGRLRLESIQNALDQARCLADGLTGQQQRYESVPWFWSDQWDIKLQIAGVALPDDECVQRGDRSGSNHAIMRLRDGRLVAVETVNMAGEHMAARKMLAAAPLVDRAMLSDPAIPLRSIVVATGPVDHSSKRPHDNIREER